MKEIQVGDIEFKVRNYLPYSELDKLNLFGLYTTQLKLQKYRHLIPKRNANETEADYMQRMSASLSEGKLKMDEAAMKSLLEISADTKRFDRSIDELLIESPKLGDCRPTVINKLKHTPEYQLIRQTVQEDLTAIMNPEDKKATIPKKD